MRVRVETARLLSFLSEQLEHVTPLETAKSLAYAKLNARNRLNALAVAGLATKLMHYNAAQGRQSWYMITDKGREALAWYHAEEAHRKPRNPRQKPLKFATTAKRDTATPKVTSVFNYGLSLL